MDALTKTLRRTFRAQSSDPFRSAREKAKKLAAQHGITIEPMHPGFNIWPAKTYPTGTDPYEGDHYAADWAAALQMVQTYATHAPEWFAGPNGKAFRDMRGALYCIRPIPGGFAVERNGIEIAGPTCSGAPAGFRTMDAAKEYAEQN